MVCVCVSVLESELVCLSRVGEINKKRNTMAEDAKSLPPFLFRILYTVLYHSGLETARGVGHS